MARKITVSFGLLTIPMKAEKATIDAPEMSNLCSGQPGKEEHPHRPVQAPKTCAVCGPIVDYTALSKGVKTGDGYAVISQEDVAEAKKEFTLEFKGNLNLIPHDAEEFLAATAPSDSVNYLIPADASAENHYRLLAELVGSHPELAFASLHTPVSATALYRVTTRAGVLVMEKRVREQNVKPLPSVGGTVNPQLYAALEGLLPTFVSPYDPEQYQDGYQAAVDRMVTEGIQVRPEGATVATSVVTTDDDLLSKLQALKAATA